MPQNKVFDTMSAMTRTLSHHFALAALGCLSVIVLAGCSSPQVVHYTLTPVGMEATSQSANKPTVTPYTLSRVTVPAQSDDLALVVREGQGKLQVLTYDRWVVALSDEATHALMITLTHQLGVPPLPTLTASQPGTKSSLRDVQVDIQRFEMIPGQSVNMMASWRIHQASNKNDIRCFANLTQPVSEGVLALVQGQQINITQLGVMIAQTLQSGPPVKGAQCQ